MRLSTFLIVLLLGCSSLEKKSEAPVPDFTITVFESVFGGYGYDILVNEKLMIHQPNIPAINANRGFPTRESARGVASLVVVKLKNNEMPPAVSVEEIRKVLGEDIL